MTSKADKLPLETEPVSRDNNTILTLKAGDQTLSRLTTDNRSTFSSLQTSQNSWIKLDCLNFGCKEITLSELNLLCFYLLFYCSRLFPCATASLFFNDNRRTWLRRIQWGLRNGKALKVVLCTKFCPLCDKQVIASALGQLRINFTCIFKVFTKLPESRVGQFCENFENTREINP